MFCKRKNGTGIYSIIINDTGYGFHIFVDIVKSESTYQDFNHSIYNRLLLNIL